MADIKDSVSTSTDESSFEDESSQEDLHSSGKTGNPSIPNVALASVNTAIQKVLLGDDGAVHWNNEHEHSFLDAHFNKPTFCKTISAVISFLRIILLINIYFRRILFGFNFCFGMETRSAMQRYFLKLSSSLPHPVIPVFQFLNYY
jgi:hypothetical protein